ncbi:hypothetical protein GCK72_022141 [Caenorhabditis remanei]|uniref:Uncharacterized protein n=1 Tax=Caenorhabditis remanei TaxID=31234 RepID=A0A6A5FT10_CAERE|nr:hypothetical protein GCK72_022141 [Caenorhabditis remanei]KAF1745694.1 hypothetical protein GCK72_022141 [Caenorhabditis remanei]
MSTPLQLIPRNKWMNTGYIREALDDLGMDHLIYYGLGGGLVLASVEVLREKPSQCIVATNLTLIEYLKKRHPNIEVEEDQYVLKADGGFYPIQFIFKMQMEDFDEIARELRIRKARQLKKKEQNMGPPQPPPSNPEVRLLKTKFFPNGPNKEKEVARWKKEKLLAEKKEGGQETKKEGVVKKMREATIKDREVKQKGPEVSSAFDSKMKEEQKKLWIKHSKF